MEKLRITVIFFAIPFVMSTKPVPTNCIFVPPAHDCETGCWPKGSQPLETRKKQIEIMSSISSRKFCVFFSCLQSFHLSLQIYSRILHRNKFLYFIMFVCLVDSETFGIHPRTRNSCFFKGHFQVAISLGFKARHKCKVLRENELLFPCKYHLFSQEEFGIWPHLMKNWSFWDKG